MTDREVLSPAQAYERIGEIMQRVRLPQQHINDQQLDAILSAMGATHPLDDTALLAEIDRRMTEPLWVKQNARESMLAFGRWVRAFVPPVVAPAPAVEGRDDAD